MNKTPLGFRYLVLALLLSVALGVSYFFFFHFSTPEQCVPNFSHVRFARVISNKDGKIHKLVPAHNGPINYAYRKLATQSSTYGGAGVHGPFRATDGELQGGTITHTNEEEQPYLDVDLDAEIAVSLVRVWNRDDEYAKRIVPFKILLAKVPFREMSLSKAEHIATASIEFTEIQTLYVWNLTHPVVARYVRIQLIQKEYLHINELEVFDTHVPDGYKFAANYISERVEAPIVQLPDTFISFMHVAGLVLKLENPLRVFDSTGMEVLPETYNTIFLHEHIPDLYVSEGEGFAGEVRVCVVFLCTDGQGYNTNADYLSEVLSNLQILSANVFHLYQYTIIIFYAWQENQVDINKQRFIRSFPYLNIKFVDVSRHFPPQLPQHLIDNKVDMSLYEIGSDCAPGNHWKLNYLHMGRFWSTKLWLEPILKDYDLIWRLDADATVDQPVKADHMNFLREMWSKKKLFAYWCRFGDTGECDTGIEEAATTFAAKKGLKFKHKDKISQDAGYWGGFGVYATQFFCYDKDWLEYVDYLDSLGGHYNHRWGEQNVFPISLSLFLEFKQLYWVKNTHLKIFHDHWPMDNCHGVNDDLVKYLTKKK